MQGFTFLDSVNSTRNDAGSHLKTYISEQLKKVTYRIYERGFFSLKTNVNRRYISDLPLSFIQGYWMRHREQLFHATLELR